MKKILPLLLLPCIAMGAKSHPGATNLRNIHSITTVTARHADAEKLNLAARHEADFELKGFVRDVSGQPLIGVSVTIKGH